MSTSTEQSSPLKSGAAGAAQFVGWDSRKYNYFEPKGRKASHYEDMTVDVQPDPKRYLIQDWILQFADGTPTYSKRGPPRNARTGTRSARSMKNGSARTISASRPSSE